MPLEVFNHLTDTRHADGAELPAPVEVWDVVESETRKPWTLVEPGRPARYKYSFLIDPAEIDRHADPRQRRGALGLVRRPLRPIKIDRWQEEDYHFWVTEWHDFGEWRGPDSPPT